MMKCDMYKILADPPEILGRGIASLIGQVYKICGVFLMITVLGYHLHKNVNGTD